MQALSRTLVQSVIWIAFGMIIVVVFHLGGSVALHMGQFAPLSGAFIGGILVMLCGSCPEQLIPTEAGQWSQWESFSWLCIGVGIIAWGIGDSFWRYYVAIGLTPFPSLADIGYVTFTILVFVGLLIQPSSQMKGRRLLLLMDSLIATSCLLAIAWYLLLGPLALASTEGGLAKVLLLYYPVSDVMLLSCVIFLLLRWQGPAQHSLAYGMSLLLIGLGLCFFVSSDFLFNLQQNAGTYVEATWSDLGWPLGLMTIGIAAILRRFPLQMPEMFQLYMEEKTQRITVSLPQYMPYGLLIGLFVVLTCNTLSPDHLQQATRPVLLATTLLVVSLVIVRQILTLRTNGRLLHQQEQALQRLTQVHQQLEEQSQTLIEQNTELTQGMDHLNRVLIQLANGNLQTRAALTNSVLWPLGVNLNILAEHVSQDVIYRQQMTEALAELSTALQQAPPFSIPDTYSHLPELSQLLSALQAYDETSGPLSRQFRLLPRSPYATKPHLLPHEEQG